MFHDLSRVARLLPLVLLCACSHSHYRIYLRDGDQLTTDGKPEFIAKTGYYRYRALNGKDALVRSDEVLRMEEQ
jgi:hypothetical protein